MALVRPGEGWAPRIERVLGALAPSARHAVPGIATLLDRVVDWNARVDLTAARSADELVDLFVADAAVIAAASAPGDARARFVDVGAGAGAPGLVLALLLPGASFRLVEPRQKRVAFLRSAAAVLGAGVAIERARSDALEAGVADVAVSRATLGPEAWVVEGARLARRAVWVLLARGSAPERSGWRLAVERAYRWPLTGVERRAFCYVREAVRGGGA